MLFGTPKIKLNLALQLDELDALRSDLGAEVERPVRWMGSLRRSAKAEIAASSTAIEGFSVTEAEAEGVIDGSLNPETSDDRMAVACYARALDHVGVLSEDPRFEWSARVIQDLHFDTCFFQRDKAPGLLRTGPISVSSTSGGKPAFVGPDPGQLPGLIEELIAWLGRKDAELHVVVAGAMAHLHLVSIHPFADGNGRISRILQSLVLARGGLVSLEFSSIENYLARNTGRYYEVLQEVQGGSYQPDRDATPWLEFCLAAHIDQAKARLSQIKLAAIRWTNLSELVAERGWPDRVVIALEQSMFAGVDRAGYAAEADIANPTATGDLRRLVDAGLVVSRGAGRSTRYVASDSLREAVRATDARSSPGSP